MWVLIMALPKFDKETFRNAAFGIGAAALVSVTSLGLPTSQAHADDNARPVAATAASYTEMGLPAAQIPTAERPYHYMRFDSQTKAQYPDAETITARLLNAEKLIVMNFIDEQNPQYSQMQTQVLNQTLAALAPRSQDKELMLMDVVVRDAQGNMPYVVDYELYFKDNKLGTNGQTLSDTQIPYMVAWGLGLKEGGDGRLFDAALMNGVRNDADLNENANAIAGTLFTLVQGYNQKKVAALASNNPMIAANLNN